MNDKWIWDFWFARDRDDWHIYFLQADKSLGNPELRHRHVSIGHAVGQDLRTWTYLGTCFTPAPRPSWDDWTTWTGSVVRGNDGAWHLFYTGTNHADGGFHQRIGHAASTDMHTWQRVGDQPALDISGPEYEDYVPSHWHDRAMRDPCVIRDLDGAQWLMFFTARVPGMAEPNAGGSIGFATSPDLFAWTIRSPVFRGGMFGQMEVPQVFHHQGRWYCLFCTSGDHWSNAYRTINPQSPVSGTHYLVADNPLGEWRVAPGPFFDGANPCRRYAGKVVATDAGLALLAFINTTPEESFVGAVSDPIPVTVTDGGLLVAHPERAGSGAIV